MYSPAQRISFDLLSFFDKNTAVLMEVHSNQIAVRHARNNALIAKVWVNVYSTIPNTHEIVVQYAGDSDTATVTSAFQAAVRVANAPRYPFMADKRRNWSKALYKEVAF